MKVRILIVILLISVINLAACINIYNPAPDTGSSSSTGTSGTSGTSTPTTPTTPTTPSIPSTPTTPTIQLVQFEDRTWVLEKYGKPGSMQNIIAGKEVSAKFDSSTSKVSGSAGCNSYTASYHRTINKVSVSGLSNTMMSCPMPSGIMAQEGAFKDALLGAESCRIIGTKLEINCTLNRVLLFEPK